MHFTRGMLITGLSALVLSHAHAGTITEYNRASFQTALASATVSGQNFDALTAGSTITTVNGVTYTPSAGVALITPGYLTTSSPNGLGSTSAGFFESTETLTITFAAPITAFALDINTFANNSGDYSATVNDGSASVVSSVYDVFPSLETGEFLGFTDTTSFTSVTIAAVNDPGTGTGHCTAGLCPYTVDTLVYGSAAAIGGGGNSMTPEPSSIALLGTGLLAMAGACKRRLC